MNKKILISLLYIVNFVYSVAFAQDILTQSIFNYYKADKTTQEKYNIINDSIEARRSRFSKTLKEYKQSGKNVDNFYYDWSNEIRLIDQMLKTETDPLIIGMLYFSYLDLGYGIYGEKLDSSRAVAALNSISPESPLWSLEPSLMEIAIRYSNNYEQYQNYILSAMNENVNPDVRNYVKTNLSPYRNIMKGKQMPEFSFHDMNDSLKNISGQTFNGKYLLIDFWATWCAPCIEEMPRLHKIYNQYHDMGLEILSISLDEELSVIQKFQTDKWQMPWYNVQATKTNEAQKIFEVTGIPYPVLFDPSGKIIAAGIELRGKNLEETLEKNIQNNSVTIDYKKIYSYCLDGDVKSALTVLESADLTNLSDKDLKFKTRFENRFKNNDNSDSLDSRQVPIAELLSIYRNYWRTSLLDNSQNYDTILIQDLANFLTDDPQFAKRLIENEDSLDIYLKKYIKSKGLLTTGFGRTGKYLDLLVWTSEKDTTYSFLLHNEKTSAFVVFMDDFITLGWQEYATLDRYYPGGWATKEALYCVKKAYDLNSEQFMISYLAHESRHFADYKIFPGLTGVDLEYRAKLTELSMAQKTLYKIIGFFISNSNYKSENAHSVANFYVVRDLSKVLFKNEFEKDIDKWKKVSIAEINKAAYDLLKVNTDSLIKEGPDVEKYIK